MMNASVDENGLSVQARARSGAAQKARARGTLTNMARVQVLANFGQGWVPLPVIRYEGRSYVMTPSNAVTKDLQVDGDDGHGGHFTQTWCGFLH